jgi:hypothetical protein
VVAAREVDCAAVVVCAAVGVGLLWFVRSGCWLMSGGLCSGGLLSTGGRSRGCDGRCSRWFCSRCCSGGRCLSGGGWSLC